MVNRTDIEATGFHEAEIKFMQMKNGGIFFQFDNIVVNIDSDDLYQVDLDFKGVSNVTCDGKFVDSLHMESAESSVLQLEQLGNLATLVVDWRYYKERRNETRAYSFEFKSCDLQFRKQQVTA